MTAFWACLKAALLLVHVRLVYVYLRAWKKGFIHSTTGMRSDNYRLFAILRLETLTHKEANEAATGATSANQMAATTTVKPIQTNAEVSHFS